jgi:hypothetical protein
MQTCVTMKLTVQVYCDVDGQSVSRHRPVNTLQSRKRTQQ